MALVGEDRTGRDHPNDRPATGRRFTVSEAADELGITVEAVRGRIKRGTVPHERDGDWVYVILDADQTTTVHDQGGDQSELVAVLREQLAEEREARRRADTIILQLSQANAALVQRVPALQAATDERREDSISHDEPVEGYPSTPPPRENEEKPARRGWWRRIIGE